MTHARRPLVALLSALVLAALAGCGDDAPKAARQIDTPQEAVSRVGDVTIRANLVPTANLAEPMAKQYGIARDEDTVLLLVSVRRGPEGADSAIPASIEASVANLHGQRRALSLREIRSGEFVDYVATTEVSPPDTLTFDLKIVREGGATSNMRFSRDFAP
jgi:hypothetical protein